MGSIVLGGSVQDTEGRSLVRNQMSCNCELIDQRSTFECEFQSSRKLYSRHDLKNLGFDIKALKRNERTSERA